MKLAEAVVQAAREARAARGSRYVFDVGSGYEVWDFQPHRGKGYTRVDCAGVITLAIAGEPGEFRVGEVTEGRAQLAPPRRAA